MSHALAFRLGPTPSLISGLPVLHLGESRSTDLVTRPIALWPVSDGIPYSQGWPPQLCRRQQGAARQVTVLNKNLP
jgi:hypothetical protein